MSDRVRLSLDLLYVAIENLLINVDNGDGRGTEIDALLTLAADMKGAITECWQSLDVDVLDEIELGG
jgi:hypothetical protein